MSCRKPDDRQRTKAWKARVNANRDRLEGIGLPLAVYQDAARWDDFLHNGIFIGTLTGRRLSSANSRAREWRSCAICSSATGSRPARSWAESLQLFPGPLRSFVAKVHRELAQSIGDAVPPTIAFVLSLTLLQHVSADNATRVEAHAVG